MPDYLVLLHEDPAAFSGMSPTQAQAVIQRYTDWVTKLKATGRLEVGKKLKDEGGMHLRGQRGKMLVSDGPYAEGKDVVSGLFVIRASSYEDARALLTDCPHFDFGWVELREIDIIG